MSMKKEVLAQVNTLIDTGQRLTESFQMIDMGKYESIVQEEELRSSLDKKERNNPCYLNYWLVVLKWDVTK